jgi:transposase InsO family protein
MKSVTSMDVVNFIKEHVIHRFGIPQTITTDGGSVFISKKFRKFTADVGIKLIRLSPYYAQANGQAEASNQSLIKLIKRNSSMAPMASRRTQSASTITASSSLSSPNTICRLKLLNPASSVFSRVVKSSASCLELATRFFSSLISRSVARTRSLRSSSSLSRSSSLWVLTEVLVLASRAAFLSLTTRHLSAISAFKEACE